MKIVFSEEDCRTLIWVVVMSLADAKIISKNKAEQIVDEEDEANDEKLSKADEHLAKRLDKAFGSLESNDVDLGDALL